LNATAVVDGTFKDGGSDETGLPLARVNELAE